MRLLNKLLRALVRLRSSKSVCEANDGLTRGATHVHLPPDKEGVNLLETEAGRFGEKDVEEGDEASVCDGEDD